MKQKDSNLTNWSIPLIDEKTIATIDIATIGIISIIKK